LFACSARLLRSSAHANSFARRDTALLAFLARFLRAYFPILAGVIIVSIFVITWWLADLSAKSLRQQIEDNNRIDAEKILSFVDGEIISTQNMLIALASSPYLQSRSIEPFYYQALQVARQLKMQIVLRDIRINEQLANTALPFGE